MGLNPIWPIAFAGAYRGIIHMIIASIPESPAFDPTQIDPLNPLAVLALYFFGAIPGLPIELNWIAILIGIIVDGWIVFAVLQFFRGI